MIKWNPLYWCRKWTETSILCLLAHNQTPSVHELTFSGLMREIHYLLYHTVIVSIASVSNKCVCYPGQGVICGKNIKSAVFVGNELSCAEIDQSLWFHPIELNLYRHYDQSNTKVGVGTVQVTVWKLPYNMHANFVLLPVQFPFKLCVNKPLLFSWKTQRDKTYRRCE